MKKQEISRFMSWLGRKAAGKPKNYSAEELAKRAARMTKLNARRKKAQKLAA